MTNNHSSNVSGEEFKEGDIAWTLISTALVWLMAPGIGFFYSGMTKSVSSLSLLSLSIWSMAIVSVQWYLIGYSLAFSRTGSIFIGNFEHSFLINVSNAPDYVFGKIPEILFCAFEGAIAGITPALVIGATAERGRFLPTLLFMFLWTTLVYDFIAYWSWSCKGWLATFGGLDFAGGNPVHLSTGVSAIVLTVILGRRETMANYKPHNIIQVVLGTALLWFGWFGFNGGSALGANTRSVFVLVVTNLAASVGGITWTLLDYRKEKKFSAVGFCFGAIAGLVTVTPGSGYIYPSASLAFGLFGALGCYFAISLKEKLGYDDVLDVVAIHGVGGIIGNVFTGIFAQSSVAHLNDERSAHKGCNSNIEPSGWLDGNWMQVPIQLAGTAAVIVWSAIMTSIILLLINKIPGFQLRLDPNGAKVGLDKAEMGESAYLRIVDR